MNRFMTTVTSPLGFLAFLYVLLIHFEACGAFNFVFGEPEASTKLHPRFDFKHFPDCSENQLNMLRTSVKEAARAASIAGQRTGSVDAIINRAPLTRGEMSSFERAALDTFEVIFDTVYFGRDNAQRSREIGKRKVRHVQSMLKLLLLGGIANKQHTVEMLCGDPWGRGPGDQSNIGPNIKWDARPLSRGGQRYVHVANDCDGTTLAYSFESTDASRYGGNVFVIVFCPAVFDNYESGKLEQYRHPARARQHRVEQWGYGLTATWLHELFHMRALFRDNVCSDDVEESPMGDSWEAIVENSWARDGDFSLRHAQSYVYWITTMFLSDSDWHTGTNLPLNEAVDNKLVCQIPRVSVMDERPSKRGIKGQLYGASS